MDKLLNNTLFSQLFLSKTFLGFVIAVAFSLNMPIEVQAQSSEQVMEQVTVTGSNIRRNRDFDTPSPIQTLDIEAIEQSGSGQTQDLFRTLTVNAGSETSTSQNGRQGVSQFSLRGLGVGGTLTLINGRRAGVSPITTDQGVFFTDINQYPVNMIQSIEVLTDGASATYGSEAVGGVVNILTRSDFEGFEVGIEGRDATNRAYSLNGAFGHSFEGGHFTTFVNYYQQDGNFRGDFDFIQQRSNAGGNSRTTASLFDSSTGAGRYNSAVGSGGGTFADDMSQTFSRGGSTVADPNCEASGPGNFVAGTNCRYNFINQRRLIAEEDRLQIFSQFDYNLTDRVDIFSELSYSANEIRDAIGGAVLRTTTDNGGFLVPAAHPFNYFVRDGTDGIAWDETQAATGNAVDVIVRQRPLTSANDGKNADDIVRQYDNLRTVFGFNADITDNWGATGSYAYSRTKYTDIQPRSYNGDAYRAAITSGRWNPFGSSTATPNAASVKTSTPLPVGGDLLSGNTDSDLALFSTNRTFVAESVQQVAEGIVSGELPELSDAVDVSAAVGVQYRRLDYEDIADSLSFFRLDGRADPVFSIIGAKQDVYAVFGETLLSALNDTLEFQFALRYEDYGDEDGGDTVDPKIGVKYQALDSVLLRGSWGTSFQAPSIRNTNGSVGSGTLDDRLGAGQTASAGSTCGSAVERGTFNSAQITTGGTLLPQSASNYNLGLVFQPDDRFTGRVDYWVYDYDDLIQTGQDFQDILDNECNNDVFTPDSRVVRDPSGQLNSVTTSFINVGKVEAEGLDFGASYFFDVLGGELALDASATYISKFDINVDGTTVFDGADNRNRGDGFGSIPDLRANFGVNWQDSRYLAGVAMRYIDGYSDNTVTDTSRDEIGSQTVFDIQLGVNFTPFASDGETNIIFGVNNLFDRDPPAIQERIAYDGEVHDPRGRIVYLRAIHSF